MKETDSSIRESYVNYLSNETAEFDGYEKIRLKNLRIFVDYAAK